MRTKLRPHGGRLIAAQLNNWPVTPRTDLNLVFVRFFVVVVGRIVVFMVVFLFGFLWSVLPFTEVLQEMWPDITRKIWISFEAHG